MGEHEVGRLIYLVLLGAVLIVYMMVSQRHQMGQMLRAAVLWALIFIGAIAAVGLWEDIRGAVTPRQQVLAEGARVEVPRSGDGHFRLMLEIDGQPVQFIVDTGATDLVLAASDARRLGIDPGTLDYRGRAQTANGVVRTAAVTLDRVALGPVVDRNVEARVTEGDLQLSLLGMSYLDRFQRIEIAGNRLVLTR